ncbi:MAG: DNA mismatch repair protein MutS, partial [Limisphaerales bacterium]
MAHDAPLTPMMAQYRRIKGELPPGTLLLFRLGDFYEMFFEDAQAGAQLLNLALTARQTIPMCGLPYHAAGGYIGRLLKAGRKVAICDQLEDAQPGKLVKREVTQILSPGAHFDEKMLAAERNNYLASICRTGGAYGLALVDLTTADFLVTELPTDAALLAELERLSPAEQVLPAEAAGLRQLLQGAARVVSAHDDWAFAPETAQFTLRDHFKVASLDGFGLRGRSAAIGAAGALLHYLVHHLRRDIGHLTRLSFYQAADFLILDAVTLRNLEVLEPLHRDASRETSLYGALNRTVTPMGARRLRDWVSQPLARLEPLRRRQDAVQAWVRSPAALEEIRAVLKKVRDLERTLSRLSVGTGNARDLATLSEGLQQLPAIKSALAAVKSNRPPAADRLTELPSLAEEPPAESADAGPALLEELGGRLSECPELVALIGRAIVDEPPAVLKEGGMIRDGFDAALDELRAAMRGGKDWIARLQRDEIERTGISSLKVGFNSVFGYYLEVTRANLDKVPPEYVRKQTVATGERFITPALKEMEAKILGAEERSEKLEYELFLRVRETVLGRLRDIQETSQALGQLDVLAALAEIARL